MQLPSDGPVHVRVVDGFLEGSADDEGSALDLRSTFDERFAEPRQAHAFDARGKRALSSVPDQNRRAWCEFIYANRRALRGLASPEPRLVPPRVASPPPLSTVAPRRLQ